MAALGWAIQLALRLLLAEASRLKATQSGLGERRLSDLCKHGRQIIHVDAAVDATLGKYLVDAGRMCAMGTSYGGYSALQSAIRHPDRFAARFQFPALPIGRFFSLQATRHIVRQGAEISKSTSAIQSHTLKKSSESRRSTGSMI